MQSEITTHILSRNAANIKSRFIVDLGVSNCNQAVKLVLRIAVKIGPPGRFRYCDGWKVTKTQLISKENKLRTKQSRSAVSRRMSIEGYSAMLNLICIRRPPGQSLSKINPSREDGCFATVQSVASLYRLMRLVNVVGI